ncbi:hypothetical protein DMX11_23425, partial [Pseudomonas sp. LB-090624]
MQIHLLFKKALLAVAVTGVLSTSIVLIPDSISQGSSAYAKDGGGGGHGGGGSGGGGGHGGGGSGSGG